MKHASVMVACGVTVSRFEKFYIRRWKSVPSSLSQNIRVFVAFGPFKGNKQEQSRVQLKFKMLSQNSQLRSGTLRTVVWRGFLDSAIEVCYKRRGVKHV